MAMYWAVHSPMPGSFRRCATASARSRRGSNRCASFAAAAATLARVATRAFGIRKLANAASVKHSGRGKACVRPGVATSSSTRVPTADTICPTRRVAAFSVICCPSTARTAISNPSHPPGTRRPARAVTNGFKIGSVDNAAAMATGSALRSNIRRTRVMIVGSALKFGNRTRTRTADCSGTCVTAIDPVAPPSSITRL